MNRCLASALSAAAALGAQSWSEHLQEPRNIAGLCEDPVAGRLLLVDAFDGLRTWSVDGDRFRHRATANPPFRSEFGLVLDRGRGQVLLVGGRTDVVQFATDTWSWNGHQWTRLAAVAPPRSNHAMAYDEARGRVVLHGGYAQQLPAPFGPSPAGETFELVGSTWQQVANTGPRRVDHAMCWDLTRGAIVLFGGRDDQSQLTADTHLFHAGRWNQLPTVVAPQGLVPRGLVHEPQHGTLVLHGDLPAQPFIPATSETWALQRTSWTRLATSAAHGGRATLDRASGAIAWLTHPSTGAHHASLERFDLARPGWTPRPRQALPSLEGPIASSQFHGTIAGIFVPFDPLRAIRTWVGDGTTWSEVAATGAPLARLGAGLAEMPLTPHFVMFGGSTIWGVALDETWSFDGSAWQPIVPAHSPSPRSDFGFAAMPSRQRIVLFGGSDGTTSLGDTWEWDGVDWLQAATTGPLPRALPAMSHEWRTADVVLYGGLDGLVQRRDTWRWDGTTWQQIGTNGPAPGLVPRLCDDVAGGRLVLHTHTVPATTWQWSGTGWTPLTTGPRGAIVYDHQRGEVVITHGHELSALTDLPATAATVGTGCAGSNGVPRLEVYGHPAVDVTGWELGVVQARPNSTTWMFLDLAPANVPLPGGCTLLLAQPILAAQHSTDAAGRVAFALPFANLRPLLGIDLLVQSAVVDPNGALGGVLALTQAQRLTLGH
jgi:hypothetical protein